MPTLDATIRRRLQRGGTDRVSPPHARARKRRRARRRVVRGRATRPRDERRPYADRPVPGLALHPARRSPSSTSGRTRAARAPARSRTSSSRIRGRPFSQVCRDELLTLRYDAKAAQADRLRFSEQPGVTVSIADYGRTESAPFYEPMYEALEARRLHARNVNIRVAGYDARLTPDMAGFLAPLDAADRGDLPRRTATGRSTSSATRTGRSTSSTC